MKKNILVLFAIVLCANPAFAVNALIYAKNGNGDAVFFRLSDLNVQHADGTVDQHMIILGTDGSRLSIPLSSIEGVYNRRSKYAVVTKSGREHIIQGTVGAGPEFFGKNPYGGTTSVTAQKIIHIRFNP